MPKKNGCEQSLTWYLHNKDKNRVKNMSGGDKNTNYDDTEYNDTNSDNNNYPGSIETSQNSIPVGQIPGDQTVGFEPGLDYVEASEGVKFMEQSSEGGVNSSVWNPSPASLVMNGGSEKTVAGPSENDSILAYKEITIDTEKQSDTEIEGDNGGKKTVNIDL